MWGSCLEAMCRRSSPGWVGDAMVWTGEGVVDDQKTVLRDSYLCKGDSVVHRAEQQAGGRWILLHEQTCRKA